MEAPEAAQWWWVRSIRDDRLDRCDRSGQGIGKGSADCRIARMPRALREDNAPAEVIRMTAVGHPIAEEFVRRAVRRCGDE
ncbi:hypothetical protein A2T55_02420 [Brevibacterium linens]|uniref:Uncharacterized protein n=1 Tax=Brevibacterium linens TaxID=1703 RepID=A0A144M8N3_BRELN|nr:hypothetical protein A2T55_02420 [Brevibacterium linens]